ncbi:MAG: hypothetical protein EOP84_04425 [Verrucomicrobiaceae bacterium]|nr:MAG: hypothetical protein EOP84_04425 [Verrucomicrobiaceae bacterium]
MKPITKYLLLSSAHILSGQSSFAADEVGFDRALEALVKDSVSATVTSKKQKVAVLEFSDLNGQPCLFGKFLAEQISIGLVLSRETFTVVDRANLKSILSEHKLTEDGLIQPENAKKLGEFSGVDALLVGSATPTPSGYLVTVKVISTDKAEICGAAKGRLPKSPDFDASDPSEPNGAADGKVGMPRNEPQTEEEKLRAKVEAITGPIPAPPKIAKGAVLIQSDGNLVSAQWKLKKNADPNLLILMNSKTGAIVENSTKEVSEVTPPFQGAIIERRSVIYESNGQMMVADSGKSFTIVLLEK